MDLIRNNLPGYIINPVPRDGLCILNSFCVNLRSIGLFESVETVAATLRSELAKDEYRSYFTDEIDVSNEVEEFLRNPLKMYNQEIADVFLEALSMAYQVNIIVFESDEERCNILNNINEDNSFAHTIYFVRAGSLHFNPVVPVSSLDEVDQNHHLKSDHEDQHTFQCNDITNQSDDEGCATDIKSSMDGMSTCEDFTITGDHKIILSDTDTDDSDPDVTVVSNPTDDSCPFVTVPNTAVPPSASKIDGFNFSNPTADDLFRIIIVDPSKYEVSQPLKGVVQNNMYTVKGCVLHDITSDDNGAYRKPNNNKKSYYVSFKDEGCKANILRKDRKGYFYKKRVSKETWQNVYVDDRDIYSLERYYRTHKHISGLKQMVVQARSCSTNVVFPHFCVVYWRNFSDFDDIPEVECFAHGNSKQPEHLSQPYIRTNPSVFAKIDQLLSSESSTSKVFHSVLDESGGPMASLSPSNEPRNIEQVQNRKKKLKKLSTAEGIVSSQPIDFEKLQREQRNHQSPVQTVVQTKYAYIAFVYTEKQLKDIELFACDNEDNEVSCVGC